MKVEHTPGPWKFDSPGGRHIRSGNGLAVAEAYIPCDPEDDGAFSERDANARLIAAAPEMLDALIQMRKAWLYEAAQGDGIMEMHGEILDQVNAVIAAAKGE